MVREMKSNKLFFIILSVIFLFFIASCSNQPKEDLEFKKMCQNAGYEWMLMKPTKDGKIMLNEKPCMGCMVEGIEHICNKQKFLEINGKNPAAFVDFSAFPKSIAPMQTVTLEFGFKDIYGNPLKPEVEHEKLVHVIVINDDFTIFSHIHPEDSRLTTSEMKDNGVFAINYTFAKPGRYIVGINFAANRKGYTKKFYVDVAGIKKENPRKDLSTNKIFGNYAVNLSYSKIIAGKPVALKYHFEQDGRPLEDMEPYLGAAMHVAIVKDDLTDFMHTHAMTGMDGMMNTNMDMGMNMPMNTNSGMEVPSKFGPNLEVDAEFPENGLYHIFAEFMHSGKIVLTHFMVEVE